METRWLLQNQKAELEVLRCGGIISNFRLKDQELNPLSFVMETVPGSGQYYQGHFVCAGRWGDPTPAEKAKGIYKHGDLFLTDFTLENSGAGSILIRGESNTEQLVMERHIRLDAGDTCFTVRENLTNTGNLSRLCNLVQHPTLAQPFLTPETIVNCNAGVGFTYTEQLNTKPVIRLWPNAQSVQRECFSLEKPKPGSTGVYSYVVDNRNEYGWITAYAPQYQMLLGYVWKREQYPWINHWLHWQDDQILYRGLEFGTTGLHYDYTIIQQQNAFTMLGENTCFLLDAGETRTFGYTGFLATVNDFTGISDVGITDQGICIAQKGQGSALIIETENSLNV